MTHQALHPDPALPAPLDPLALFERPAQLGRHGAQARRRAFGDAIWVRPAPVQAAPAVAALLRGEAILELAAWPEPAALQRHDRVVVQVAATPADRARFVAWLHALADTAPAELSVAPCSPTPGGMQRLWCIATARVLLPDTVRVEARHDLIGIRLAQLAVGFGADTLAGPIAPDRTLPLAGVTRPDEATRAGLATLIRQVGLAPHAA
jgi:hypothetical protein